MLLTSPGELTEKYDLGGRMACKFGWKLLNEVICFCLIISLYYCFKYSWGFGENYTLDNNCRTNEIKLFEIKSNFFKGMEAKRISLGSQNVAVCLKKNDPTSGIVIVLILPMLVKLFLVLLVMLKGYVGFAYSNWNKNK